ncbi:MAG: efflux RND transporter periplasmic adaptor subunit [Planctomycetes bacterium]|nr:efflux RND transporter periplasmic adaptor subunit [Planctomycetota bacterium]
MDGSLPIAVGSAAGAKASRPRLRRALLASGAGAAVLAAGALGLWVLVGQSAPAAPAAGETARAVKDRLVVTITESGEIDAKRSTNVVCQVESTSTIVWVIEEGTVVKQGEKLIELDSADLQERLRTQDMTYKTAKAAFEKADKTYLITESQRESLLSAAGLTVKFALMDFRKYLGTDLSDRVVAQEGKAAFDALVKDPALGGAALQQKRKLQSDIDLAGEELSRAASKVEWTRALKEKGYVTGNELQADELAWKRNQVLLDEAKTAVDLFQVYEFPKAAEKAYTDWLEAKREYDRVDARTKSEVDTAKADRDNRQEALSLEETRLKKTQDQLAKCTITAPQPGMVVYDTTGGRFDRIITIEPGATVRHQQNLIKLPDMSEMVVKVKLHESVVKQAAGEAPAYVTIDALPRDRLTGKVTKIAVMPDRSQWWLNPGLKTYVTEVTLDESPPGLKPGMSAQVEILVDTRQDVLQVPISAVFVDQGFQVVYVKAPTGVETRRVEVGLSNDRMVEIVKGVSEADEVYLYKPAGAEELKVSEEEKKARQEAEWKKAAQDAARLGPPAAPEETPAADRGRSADDPGVKGPSNSGGRPSGRTSSKGERGPPSAPGARPADRGDRP